jgi:putative ABC transport system substrate-binding protein
MAAHREEKMNKTSVRAFAIVALAVAALASPTASSQDANRVWKVGILWHAAGPAEEEVFLRPFLEGMRELGYVEGRNLVLDQTYVDEHYERFPAKAEELVARKVDVILASMAPAAVAARKVTRTVPIVFATSGDPVKLGLVDSMSRPGGNATGLTLFYPELSAKYAELMRELVPSITRVAVLLNPVNVDHPIGMKELEKTAQGLGLQLVTVEAKAPEEFPAAFAAAAKAKVGGLIVLGDAMYRINRKALVELAAANRLPAIYGPRDFAVDGGLLTCGVRIPGNFRRSAVFVDKILKGAKPGDLPVERPYNIEIVVNMKTAAKLGITVPESLLLRASEVMQ